MAYSHHRKHRGSCIERARSLISLPSIVVVIQTLLLTRTLADPELPLLSSAPDQTDTPECRSALGMQSGDIADDAITASSSYDVKSVGPLNARIRTERNGGAWCPKAQINKDVYEYLEIDLGEVKVVTMVETQGRFGNGQGLEFAPHYMLEYQRQTGGRWVRYSSHKTEQIIKGNSNTYLSEIRELKPPIITRRVRFIPYSVHARTICMRVELHGCPWQVGLLSYNMPQGESRGAEVDLYDFLYDGTEKDGYLSGGLGQLIDYNYGEWNFRLNLHDNGHKGYEWIGWKNDSVDGAKPIEILYRFDVVRNFTKLQIHCNNLFSKDIRVFRKVELYFSIGGEWYNQDTLVQFEYFRDSLMHHARNVTIPIPNRVGKYVKLLLYFDARWIMISETTFDSVPTAGNFTPESPPVVTKPVSTSPALPVATPSISHDDVRLLPLPESGSDNKKEKSDSGPDVNVWQSEEKDRTSQGPRTSESPVDVYNKPGGQGNMDDTYIGIIIGTLTAMVLLLIGLVVFFVLRKRRKKFTKNSLKVFGTDINDLTYGLTNGKLANGNMYNAVATTDLVHEKQAECHRLTNGDLSIGRSLRLDDSLRSRNLPDLPESAEMADNEANISRDYASPDLTKLSPLIVSLPPCPVYQSNPSTVSRHDDTLPPPHPPPPQAQSMSPDSVNIQGWSGNSMYAIPNQDLIWQDDASIIEFPREKLKFVDKLGEGQFGEVHLCEAQTVTDVYSDEFFINRSGARTRLVAVKMLRPDASSQARSDFHQEVRILSRIKDPNIVHVLGVCTQGEPLAVVVEYMKYGDLHQFLLSHVPDTTINHNKPFNLISYGCLIYMATQIASGMKYLETLNMVHRDLATRNCLVGSLYSIKISDFGMSRNLYSRDYYRIDGKAVLPIRWMAWESVLLGKFSCKSDVWSFAVTLWETLTFARQRPFEDLPDDKVIENCGHYYRNDCQELHLPQPSNCPKEIYDLMCECWNRDESLRPTFREIHMFLSRKNMGYDPREEKPMKTNPGFIPSS